MMISRYQIKKGYIITINPNYIIERPIEQDKFEYPVQILI